MPRVLFCFVLLWLYYLQVICVINLPVSFRVASLTFMMTSLNVNIFRVTGLCAGNSLVTGEFPPQRPVIRSFDVSFDLHLNKRLSKQSSGWWFEMLSRSLWRHCNVGQLYDSPTVSDVIPKDDIDRLVQDCSNSSALAVEVLQSCTKPLIWLKSLQYLKKPKMLDRTILTELGVNTLGDALTIMRLGKEAPRASLPNSSFVKAPWIMRLIHWITDLKSIKKSNYIPCSTQLKGYTGFTLSVCPSVRLWTESCLLCIFHNTSWIHFIFTHLIKQLQKVCHF